jgi:hypothetical protein
MRLFRHVDPTFNRLAPTKNSRTLSDSVTSLNRLGMSPICAFLPLHHDSPEGPESAPF